MSQGGKCSLEAAHARHEWFSTLASSWHTIWGSAISESHSIVKRTLMESKVINFQRNGGQPGRCTILADDCYLTLKFGWEVLHSSARDNAFLMKMLS